MENLTNILLINTNVSQCARAGYGATPAPAGLVSLGGVLKTRGHDVKIAQVRAHALKQDEKELPLLREELLALMEDVSPDLIGMSARNVGAARRPANPFHLIEYYSAFFEERVVRASRMISDAPIVMGGAAFSIEPGLYLKHAKPDFGIIGEAEESLPALIDALAAGDDVRQVPGLAMSAADIETAYATARPPEDLSCIGPGACDLMRDFRSDYYKGGGFAPIQTMRGCAMQCVYCTTPFLEGASCRYRPMGHVIGEMRAYVETWGARHFFIIDNTFNDPIERGLATCEAILESGLDVKWFTEITPARVTDELCRVMVKAGCIGVTLGADACCDAVLKTYAKPFTVAQLRDSIALLKRHDIPFDTSVIIGGPGETRDTLTRTLNFCNEHLKDHVVRFFDGMIINSRTPAFEIAAREGVIDPARPYEDIVFENDFRAIKKYEYFFPRITEKRNELLDWIAKACRQKHWVLTSKDYPPDPDSGELSLHPDITIQPGARPWWKGLTRKDS